MSIWSRLRSLLAGSADGASPPAGDEAASAPSQDDGEPGDDRGGGAAPQLSVHRDHETEEAARVRIQQVRRALGITDSPDGAGAEPPWARGKNRPGRLPSGPGRPPDAFFVLTVVLDSELPSTGEALAAMLDGAAWPSPRVRLIPLIRNGVAEPGYSAEVTAGNRRAFLLYRQQPYGDAGGAGHVGVFIGGKGPAGDDAQGREKQAEEGRLIAALALALLQRCPAARGVVKNREDKRWLPREQALVELAAAATGPSPGDDLAGAG